MIVFVRALAVWVVIILAETVHGVLRNQFLVPVVGDFRSRQIGVFIGSVLILAITILSVRWINASSSTYLIGIGALWAFLTLLFELALALILRLDVRRIVEDYDLMNGGLMPLGLLFLWFTPVVAHRIRKQ
ncbi:MAG: hypothetical protein ABI878_04955 [Acidobacteriota bacterium]